MDIDPHTIIITLAIAIGTFSALIAILLAAMPDMIDPPEKPTDKLPGE